MIRMSKREAYLQEQLSELVEHRGSIQNAIASAERRLAEQTTESQRQLRQLDLTYYMTTFEHTQRAIQITREEIARFETDEVQL